MRCTNVITKTFDRNRQINWHFSCQFRSPYPPLPKHELPDQNPANIPTTGAGFTLDLDLSSWDNHLERSWKPSCHPSSKLIGRSGPWWPHLQDFQPTWHLQRSCLWPMSSTKIDEFHSLGLLESVLYITRHTPKKKNSDQWFDGRWFSSAPSKLHQLLLPKKWKKQAAIETHRTEGKLSATDFFCKMVSQRLLWVRFTLYFPFPTRNWYWFWYLTFDHQVEYIIGLNKCLFHKEFTSQNSNHNSTRFGHLGPLKLHLKTDGALQSEALDDWYHALNPYKAWILWLVSVSWSISSWVKWWGIGRIFHHFHHSESRVKGHVLEQSWKIIRVFLLAVKTLDENESEKILHLNKSQLPVHFTSEWEDCWTTQKTTEILHKQPFQVPANVTNVKDRGTGCCQTSSHGEAHSWSACAG